MSDILNNVEFSPFLLACRELELCGYCPHEKKNNDLDKRFDDCTLAREHGVSGCHVCIKRYFETDYDRRRGFRRKFAAPLRVSQIRRILLKMEQGAKR